MSAIVFAALRTDYLNTCNKYKTLLNLEIYQKFIINYFKTVQMKKIAILFVFSLCVNLVFAQSEMKHPKNGKSILIYDNKEWAYKSENNSFTDSRDEKTYKTVTIGTQVWMAENLAYYYPGCRMYYSQKYPDTLSNFKNWGYLYSGEIALNVCPTGWHVPTEAEWTTLINYLGGEWKAPAKLKSATGWKLFRNENLGNNQSGFNALPGGCFQHELGELRDDEESINPGHAGIYGFWHCNSSDVIYLQLVSRDMGGGLVNVSKLINRPGGGIADGGGRVPLSIRCIKD